MLTDIFSDGNLLITPHHTSYLSYNVKIRSVLVDGKLQDFLSISSWLFLSTANNLVPCPKSTSAHQTHTPSRLQGKKPYCLGDSVWTILLCIQISVVSISKAGTKSKSSSYKNDFRSDTGKYHLKNILDRVLITTLFQNTLSNQL